MTPWLTVLGIGEDGLEPAGRALVESAELLVGGERHLALAGAGPAERMAWERPLSRTIAAIIARRPRPTVVLATGDPMWFGIGASLARRVPAGEMRILPTVGAFSLAAARLAWPLQGVAALSLHGRSLGLLALHVAPGARLLVLSHDGGTPTRVADWLTRHGYGASRMVTLAHMGGPQEACVEGRADDWTVEIPDLNTLAIECIAGAGARIFSRAPGLPDEFFEHDGMLTRAHIRAATLALLAPTAGAHLWDIGAGSGAVSIEWIRAGGTADAVEPVAARRATIALNAEALGAPGLEIHAGHAPAALEGLPAPDAAFLGGGLSVPGVLESAWEALQPGGRIVANAVTLESEMRLARACSDMGGDLYRVSVETAAPIGRLHAFRPAMTVTQWAARKPWRHDP
ncbi:MAG: precorrin-6y C5,15-methyltransferase (decarboxylating) subunit CbiE [Alphaproteobacteria bacterium]|nr:precorrin-6y C5,15-methyltransferase (decarboxylating) subunit CbiE [Alphaproteobacteria bacterium]MCY4318891.1 precorrin-6y C5,15-methyltransferase (decarboxylating) subunit CbiE [Alphaproteobacteria bacterium]